MLFEQERRPGLSHVAIRDCNQRIDIDYDSLGGVFRQCHGISDDDCERLADKAHFLDGDDWLLERLQTFELPAASEFSAQSRRSPP